tara:strand:- start:346 stop:1557 length:1212 start_codon:yes stop_codon:yes gene_type:complete
MAPFKSSVGTNFSKQLEVYKTSDVGFGLGGITPDVTSTTISEVNSVDSNRYTDSTFLVTNIIGDYGNPSAKETVKVWVEGGIAIRPESQPVEEIYYNPNYVTGATYSNIGQHYPNNGASLENWLNGTQASWNNHYTAGSSAHSSFTLSTPIDITGKNVAASFYNVGGTGFNEDLKKLKINGTEIINMDSIFGGNGHNATIDLTSAISNAGITSISTVRMEATYWTINGIYVDGIAINSGINALWLRWPSKATWALADATALSGSLVSGDGTKTGTRNWTYPTYATYGSTAESVLPPAVGFSTYSGTWVVGDTVQGTPTTVQGTKRYLQINSSGNITDISASDPGFTDIGFVNNVGTITFPSTFSSNGLSPDATLSNNVTIQASTQLKNRSGSSTGISTALLPQ